jgi:hypothetical protein
MTSEARFMPGSIPVLRERMRAKARRDGDEEADRQKIRPDTNDGEARRAGPSCGQGSVAGDGQGATHRYLGHVRLDVGPAGNARVKRMIYPAGFRWSKDMKPVVGTDLCMHAHVGFLARGEIHIEYADGCVVEHTAPQIVAIEPGHDGWVVGKEPVVLIEFDFEGDTVQRLGMPDAHRH